MTYKVDMRRIHNEVELKSYPLRIPKAWARGEANTRPTNLEDVEKIPHYELRVLHQVGTIASKRDTIVLFKLESGNWARIIIHPRGGVSFDKTTHVNLIRETDELDRRIVIGFCKKYEDSIKSASYEFRYKNPCEHLQVEALCYKASYMPKRIKQGPTYNIIRYGEEPQYYNETNYVGEENIFSNICFLGA